MASNLSGLQALLASKKGPAKRDGNQTLQGNGAEPPAAKRDKATSASKAELSAARRKAIANLTPHGAANDDSRRAARRVLGSEEKVKQTPNRRPQNPRAMLLETDKKTSRPRGKMTLN